MTRNNQAAVSRTLVHSLAAVTLSMVLTGCGNYNNTPYQAPLNLPTTTPTSVVNTVPVTVGITPATATAPSSGSSNGAFTFVTVCRPAVLPVGQNPSSGPPPPATCKTIQNILVDTGSVGLRLLESSDVDSLMLPTVNDSNNNPVQECVEFADFSYVWGPVARATIEMADETAAQVPAPFTLPADYVPETPGTGIPIQIITPAIYLSTGVPANCLSSTAAGGAPIAANTLQTLGANGILGIGSALQDCGAACASSTPRNQYYSCPSNQCSVDSLPLDQQLWNPVAAFQYDNNGISLALPYAPFGGSASVPGTLTFGINTQSNNELATSPLGSQTQIYALDGYGNFPEVTLTEQSDPSLPPSYLVNYLSPQNGSYLDSGSPAIYFGDPQNLVIPACPNPNGNPLSLYCPGAATQFFAKVYGTNKTTDTVYWYVENGPNLLNSGNSVFSTLGGSSGIDASTDYVDFGLPFFLGKTVFVGFAGTALDYPQTNNPITYTNGYWAF